MFSYSFPLSDWELPRYFFLCVIYTISKKSGFWFYLRLTIILTSSRLIKQYSSRPSHDGCSPPAQPFSCQWFCFVCWLRLFKCLEALQLARCFASVGAVMSSSGYSSFCSKARLTCPYWFSFLYIWAEQWEETALHQCIADISVGESVIYLDTRFFFKLKRQCCHIESNLYQWLTAFWNISCAIRCLCWIQF